MKKKLLIAILVLTVVLVGVMAGCKTKLTTKDFYNIASYTTSSSQTRSVSVSVKQGETLIYSNVDGEVQDPYNIGFGNAISQEVGSGLKFEKAYFESEVVVNGNVTSKYTAKIVDTAAFLGVNDAQNATIEVVVNTEAKTLASTTIKYDAVKSSATYAVEIVVTVG